MTSWAEISSLPEYQSLDLATRRAVREKYFTQNYAVLDEYKSLDPQTQQAVFDRFDAEEEEKEKYARAKESRGIVSDAASSFAAGIADAIGTGGHLIDMADATPYEEETDPSFLDKIGRSVSDWSEGVADKRSLLPTKEQQRGEYGFVREGFLGGVRSIPLSAVPLAAGIAGTAIGGPAVGIAAGGTALVGMFGGGQYGQEYSNVRKELDLTQPNLSEEEKREIAGNAAFGNAAFEVGTEMLPFGVFMKFFGGKQVLTQPIKATLKNLTRQSAKELIKSGLKTTAAETTGEMIAGGGQNWVRKSQGLISGSVAEGVAQSIIPSLTMSMFIGVAGVGMNRMQSSAILDALNSNDVKTRVQAVNFIGKRIAENTKDTDLASTWLSGAKQVVQSGAKFDPDQRIIDFTTTHMQEDLATEEKKADPLQAKTVDEAIGAFKAKVSQDKPLDVPQLVPDTVAPSGIPLQIDNTGLPMADQGVAPRPEFEQTPTTEGEVSASRSGRSPIIPEEISASGVSTPETDTPSLSKKLTLANSGEVAAPAAVSLPELKSSADGARFGLVATPEQVTALERKVSEGQTESKRLLSEKKISEAGAVSQKYQPYDDALHVIRDTPVGKKLKAKLESKKADVPSAQTVTEPLESAVVPAYSPDEYAKTEHKRIESIISGIADKIRSGETIETLKRELPFRGVILDSPKITSVEADVLNRQKKININLSEQGRWPEVKAGDDRTTMHRDQREWLHDQFRSVLEDWANNLQPTSGGKPPKGTQSPPGETAVKKEYTVDDYNSGRAYVEGKTQKLSKIQAMGTANGTRQMDSKWESGAVKRFISGELQEITKGKQVGKWAKAKVSLIKAETVEDVKSALSNIWAPEAATKPEPPKQASAQAAEVTYEFGSDREAQAFIKKHQAEIENVGVRKDSGQTLGHSAAVRFTPKAGAKIEAPGGWYFDDDSKPVWMTQEEDRSGFRGPYSRQDIIGLTGETPQKPKPKSGKVKPDVKYAKATSGGEKFATRGIPSLDAVDLKQILSVPKVKAAGKSADGSLWAQISTGDVITIKNVPEITPDKIAFELGYGRPRMEGEKIAGTIINKDGKFTIELTKGLADRFTLAHEIAGHLLEMKGVVRQTDKEALGRALKREGKENTEENRAQFIENVLRDRDMIRQYGSFTKRAILRIVDALDAIINVVHRTARGYIRALENDSSGYSPAQGEEGMVSWHGTPHVWPPEKGFPHGRPRLDKIGTGEGAAAYGWGWYTAEEKGVAVDYRDNLSGRGVTFRGETFNGKFPQYGLSDAIVKAGLLGREEADELSDVVTWRGVEKTISEINSYISRYKNDLENSTTDFQKQMNQSLVDKFKKQASILSEITDAGSLYQLDIPDDVMPKLLDWDRPLSEQSGEVRVKLEKTLKDFGVANMIETDPTGEQIYNRIALSKGGFGKADKTQKQAASEYLASIGIPGNKYLDQFSRSKGDGSRNFVIWDQPTLDRIALLERNGEKLDAIRYATAQNESGMVGSESQFGPVDTDSNDFRAWFGDSKVVNPDGSPMVVYHGSHVGITKFKRTRGAHLGFHFGDVEAANTRLEDTGEERIGGIDYGEMDKRSERLYNEWKNYENELNKKDTYVSNAVIVKELEAGRDIDEILKPYKYKPTPEESAKLEKLKYAYEKSIPPIWKMGEGANIGTFYLSAQKLLKLKDVGNWGAPSKIKEALPWDSDARTLEEIKQEIIDRGYDGVVYANMVENPVMRTNSYIVFNPTQIKSAMTNTGAFDPSNPDIRYATSHHPPESVSAPFGTKRETTVEKVTNALKLMKSKEGRDYITTKTLDRLHPIAVDVDENAYQLHRMLPSGSDLLGLMIEHGKISVDKDGMPIINTRKKGLRDLFNRAGGDWNKLPYWVAAKRAEAIHEEDDSEGLTGDDRRERLLTKAWIKEAFAWAGDSNDPKMVALAKELKEFNDSVLDYAVSMGLISKEFRDSDAMNKDYYIPFYRIMEDEKLEEVVKGPFKSNKFISARIKKYSGSDKRMGDPLENLLKNWSHLLSEGLRNKARASVGQSQTALQSGVVEIVPPGKVKSYFSGPLKRRVYVRVDENGTEVIHQRDEKTTFVRDKDASNILMYQENGKPVYLQVNDPDLFNAMTNMNMAQFDNMIFKLLRTSKKWLTYGATFGPAFRVANAMRDTVQTALLDKSFKPFIDTYKGFISSMREDEKFIGYMTAGGASGSSYIKADSPEAAHDYIKKILKAEGKDAKDRILDTPKKMLGFWEKIGAASEYATKVQYYSNLLEKGETRQEAAFKARDILDFAMSGSSPVVQAIIQTVPFINARFEGLYKLGRSVKDKDNRKNFITRGTILTAATIALWMLNKDDDRWKELEDYDKWSYYHFWIGDAHFRIPKPFEVGAAFSSLPETFLDVLNGNNDTKHIADFIGYTGTQTFAIGIPQLFQPLIEQWANKSAYTGRPIVGQALEGLQPGEQAEPWTSETLRQIGKTFNVSPKRAEALVQGYFSTLGMTILGGADIATRNAFDFPEQPTGRIDDYPLVGRFVRQGEEPRSTRYSTWFYDTFDEMDMLNKTYNYYTNTGEMLKAKEIKDANKKSFALKKSYNKVRKQLTDMNKEIKKIYRDKAMSKAQKKDKIDSFYKKRNDLVKKAYIDFYKGE